VLLRPKDPVAAPPPVVASSPTPTAAPTPSPAKDPAVPAGIPEEVAKELRYLPEKVQLASRDKQSMGSMPNFISGSKRMRNVRPLTDKAKHGEFLAPKWSPDGLQVLASRPGFDGIYVIDARTGEPRRIADGNAFHAKWNAEGNVEVVGEDGLIRTYDPEGTLLSTAPKDTRSGPAFAEDDAIHIRREDGTTMAITSGEDRFFNPVVSPDGKMMIYSGLLTGLYMAPTDGSSEPVYLGRGNNVNWMPDSSGLVFDVTADDGHHLTEGDIYFVDRGLQERTNMTPGDSHVSQSPSVDPVGGRVAFEANGEIFVGEVN
jgi:Tol biopolymer transport system component